MMTQLIIHIKAIIHEQNATTKWPCATETAGNHTERKPPPTPPGGVGDVSLGPEQIKRMDTGGNLECEHNKIHGSYASVLSVYPALRICAPVRTRETVAERGHALYWGCLHILHPVPIPTSLSIVRPI